MTRETKLGLVVSCSFVCLLGTVLFIKLNEGASVPPSPYAKADGSAPDLPEEPVPIQVTVAPAATGSEAPTAPAAPGNNSAENRSTSPVMALPPPTFDPNVMRAEATTGPQAGADKNSNTAPAPLPVPPTPPTPGAAPAPAPSPASGNDFSALVPPLPSAPAPASPTPAPQVKDAAPKTPMIDGLPKKEPENSAKDAAPAVPPPPHDGLPQPNAKPQARESKPAAGSKQETKIGDKEGKHAPVADSQGQDKESNLEKKDKRITGTPVTPLPGLEDKSKDSSPSVPLPTPDPQASTAAGILDRRDSPPPSPANRQGAHSLGAAPVETPLPGVNATPNEPTPVAPQGGAPRAAEGSGLPVPGTGLLTPPPKPPSASATPSAVSPIPSPSPEPAPGTSTSTAGTVRPEIPSPTLPGAPPTPAPREPVPAMAPSAPSELQTGTPGTVPAPAPNAVPRPNAPSPTTPTPDANAFLSKPMTPALPANQYAQAPTQPRDPLQAGSRPVPPVGAPVAGTSPPIAIPAPPGTASFGAASGTPRVESYDEETYLCRASDSFEEISARYYNSKNYAQALLLFNRNHPRATAALQKDQPVLAEGQALYIPPMRILEKQYPSAIPGYKPATPAPVPDMARTTARSLPTSPSPQYRVRKANEMIPIIARDTLGRVDRWTEIYQLNKGRIDPAWPLPVGTVLAMPADAKVPPENKP